MMMRNDEARRSLRLCQKLLQSWLESLNDKSRKWNQTYFDDLVMSPKTFNTFGITIPNTNTRATLKDGVFSIFDCSISGSTSLRTNQLRSEAGNTAPSNVPLATDPAIAKSLFLEIEQLVAYYPSLTVEVTCDEPSGFAFNVTGELALLPSISPGSAATRKDSMQSLVTTVADDQSHANHRFLMVFRQSRKMVKGIDYIADEDGHVTFLKPPGNGSK